MRLIKMFGLAALAAMATMAFVGATPASATSTQLCNSHTSLTCSSAATSVHWVLKAGTIGKLLSPISVLCLGLLLEATAGALGSPQGLDASTLIEPVVGDMLGGMTLSGCGTGSGHNNCTATTKTQPSFTLLKTGLDEGSLEALNGEIFLECKNIGIKCTYDLQGSLFSVGGNHLVANEVPTIELEGKFLCPDEGYFDWDLQTLSNRYVLQ